VLIGVGYLLVSKVSPQAGWSVDNVVIGKLGEIKTGIEQSAIWQQYDVWISAAFFSTVTALLVYRGRDMYDNIRGIARVRATDKSIVAPAPSIATTPAGATVRPITTTSEKDETPLEKEASKKTE